MKQMLILASMVLALQACTWVKLSDEGKKVRVLGADEVTGCTKLGKASVSLKSKVAGFDRSRKKVQEELEMLGRNTAVELGGDTIVPVTPIKDGKQVFDVYRCIPRKSKPRSRSYGY